MSRSAKRAKRRQSTLSAGAVLLAAGLVLLGNSSSRGASVSRNISRVSFCSGAPVRNFERPFKHMPPDHPIPESGVLPFSPHVEIYALARPLVVGKGVYGFGFNFNVRNDHLRALRWTLRLALKRLDLKGKVVRSEKVVTRRVRNMADLRKTRLELELGGRPALYKTRLEIQSGSGKTLGTYTQYLRVVKPVISGNLKLDERDVSLGNKVALRVDNVGTVPIDVGSGYQLERFNDEQWQTIVREATTRGRDRLRVLFAGESSSCEYLLLTEDLDPGQYRLSKEVQWRSGQRRRLGAQFRLRD